MPANDSLQFDRVEQPAGDATCTRCKRPLGTTYYQYNTAIVCSLCKAEIESQWNDGTPISRLGRALLYGLPAAGGGIVVFVLVTLLTGATLGIISIAVGFAVGRAI